MKSFNEIFEKKSPYKKETLLKYKQKWKNGEKIPFGVEASLKAQGMIPRADGTYEVSDEYKKDGVKPTIMQRIKKVLEPETKAPESHREKVEKRIHKEEKKKLENIIKPKPIKEHPDSTNKGVKIDKDLEGNSTKKILPKKLKQKSVKKKLKKYYNPKALSENTVPSFYEYVSECEEAVDTSYLEIKSSIPSYLELKKINESIKD